MTTETNKGKNWKQKILHGMIEYYVSALYMAIFFAVFVNYRRLILAHYDIRYETYGIAIIKGMVLAKVVLIVESLRFGRAFKDKPAIIPTVYKSIIFTICLAIFSTIEFTVMSLIRGKGLLETTNNLMGQYNYEWLSGALVVFFAFIPFFAVGELRQVLGKGVLFRIFFRKKWAIEAEPVQQFPHPLKSGLGRRNRI